MVRGVGQGEEGGQEVAQFEIWQAGRPQAIRSHEAHSKECG